MMSPRHFQAPTVAFRCVGPGIDQRASRPEKQAEHCVIPPQSVSGLLMTVRPVERLRHDGWSERRGQMEYEFTVSDEGLVETCLRMTCRT